MKLDTLALIGFAFIGILWASAIFAAFVMSFPMSLIAGIPLVIFSIILIVVIRQRLNNKEDDYYSKNIEQ